MARRVRITQVRGLAGTRSEHRGTMRALGLRRIRQSVVLDDSPHLRGMLRKVDKLIVVEETDDA